jgi:hypothetical protein
MENKPHPIKNLMRQQKNLMPQNKRFMGNEKFQQNKKVSAEERSFRSLNDGKSASR